MKTKKSNKAQLRALIREEIERIFKEGVRPAEDGETFSFDFSTDKSGDIISLVKQKPYQIKAFGHTYYYAYEFAPDVDSKVRTKFIHYIKTNTNLNEDNINNFVISALDKLNQEINLSSFTAIVYPQSIAELNRKCLRYINSLSDGKIMKIELVKNIPSQISFNFEAFEEEILGSLTPDGRPRYTEAQKQEVLQKINQVMEKVHSLDYFSIARDIKKPTWRKYIENFYHFQSEEDAKAFSRLKGKVLILDDIVTSGATISNLLKAIRIINHSNEVVLFSIIGSNKIKEI